jgi:IMP dehydrogenase/GMP reductase
MATKEVQKDWGSDNIKTSEGVVRIRPVEYTLSQWSENFEAYLRSAMSYTNCKTLEEFKNNVTINQISEESYKRFNK